MPRFYFDFRQGGILAPDDTGLELADAEQAYLEVFKASVEMWRELLKERSDPRRCAFEVRDHSGKLLFVFPLQEALEVCADRRNAGAQTEGRMKLLATRNHAQQVMGEYRQELEKTRQTLSEYHRLLRSIPAP